MKNGVHSYPDGSRYEGQWLNGRRHGHGAWTKPDGTNYVGEWEDDRPHGQGTLTWPNGKKHTGEWKDGKRHGPGVEMRPDGTKLYGKWEDGIFVEVSKSVAEDEILTPGFSEARKESAFQPQDNKFASKEAKHYRQKKTRKRSLIWPGFLVVTIILGLAAIVFILTGSEDKYTASGRVVNYAGEGIAGVTIGFGEGYGTAKTDENGYWAKSDLQGEITVTPQNGNVLFNPIRSKISKAEDEANFALLKEVDKGVTSSAGEYVFSSHLTAAEEVEITVIVDDYESGEKLEGIDVEVVVGVDTIEIFLQDDEGFYLPTIIVLEMERLEEYPGVEVKSGSLLVSIRTRLLSNNYLQWAIQNPREASADVALSIAVGLDVYGAISYTAGGIAIMTAPATAGLSALPGANAIALGFAMDIVSEFLKVYAADVYRGIEKTEHSLTIYIYESHESSPHAKLLVPAGTSIDEIIKAVDSKVGDRAYEIMAPETNPAGAYYNNDGTPKFLKVILKDQAVQVSSNNLFIYPVKEYQNNTTQGFGSYLPDYAGKKYNGFHSAEDVTVFASAPVFSIADGTVEKIAKLGNLGHLIALKHDGNFIIPGRAEHKGNQYYEYPTEEVSTIYSIYVHVTPINGLKEKQSVKRGQKIGYIADISSAGLRPHLHFEIRHPKQKPSPTNWSLVGDESNWSRFAGGSYNGYYKNLQEMVDAGLRHPSDFISQNISDPGQEFEAEPERLLEEFYVVNVEVGSNLYVRKRPGTKNKPADDIIDRIPKGKLLKVINKHDNNSVIDNFTWWEVMDIRTDISGWVASEYLEETTQARIEIESSFYDDPILQYLGWKQEDIIGRYGEPDFRVAIGGPGGEFLYYTEIGIMFIFAGDDKVVNNLDLYPKVNILGIQVGMTFDEIEDIWGPPFSRGYQFDGDVGTSEGEDVYVYTMTYWFGENLRDDPYEPGEIVLSFVAEDNNAPTGSLYVRWKKYWW